MYLSFTILPLFFKNRLYYSLKVKEEKQHGSIKICREYLFTAVIFQLAKGKPESNRFVLTLLYQKHSPGNETNIFVCYLLLLPLCSHAVSDYLPPSQVNNSSESCHIKLQLPQCCKGRWQILFLDDNGLILQRTL